MRQTELQLLAEDIGGLPVINQLEVEIVDIEYRKESGDRILRIFIDTEKGVDLETCAAVTRAVKAMMDDKDQEYDHIEVSSPGLDRILKKDKDFARFKGNEVRIKMLKDYDGFRKLKGILQDFDESFLMVERDGKIINVPRAYISVVRLNPEF